MKYTIAILLLFALIAQTFSRSLALADYLVNVEVYKKSCINKAKPMLHCNGKCQMLKKIKKQEGQGGNNTSAPKFNQQDEVLSSKTFFPTIVLSVFKGSLLFIDYNNNYTSFYHSSIFHPPANCNNI